MKKQKDLVRPHVADGIKEYDNPMPRWWVGLLYITIAFAVFYMVRLHLMDGLSLEQELKNDLQTSQAKRVTSSASVNVNAGDLTARLKSPDLVNLGKDIFATNCLACHGAAGEGGIGPNLTDKYWLNGGRAADIVRTITDGVAAKGMPPWGPILGEKKVEQVAAFILSLIGTSPSNPKAPQGELFDGTP